MVLLLNSDHAKIKASNTRNPNISNACIINNVEYEELELNAKDVESVPPEDINRKYIAHTRFISNTQNILQKSMHTRFLKSSYVIFCFLYAIF